MKKTSLKVITIFSFIIFSSNSLLIAREKREAINELLDLSGINSLGEEMVDNAAKEMIEALQEKRKNLPKRVYEIINEEKDFFKQKELVKKKTLYNFLYYECDRKFSYDQVEELIAFYKTPLGEKTLSMYKTINSEGIKISYKWYNNKIKMFPRMVKERLEEEGVLKTKLE
ncbi:DUF2059 domain-containing protein [Desulforhopalus singaporensis]|uniref:DUF2059 domain-containing protein n=1 Tax=Desulforhopalus singaporensis TaxID=91360 RepID=A0A1H0KBQ8_9BACT|nr:DUF2059 domain-containing protein [Desulforhopalus singaporensis]SDO53269.1 hypothetical protein SAMN05660330_00438 [Desulforhopalus singaporensis]